MPPIVHDLVKAASTATQNQLKARAAAQQVAAQVAAQRPATPPTAAVPAEAEASGAG